MARDPHWLYAHWDLTREQLRHYNSLSVNRHLVVRVYLDILRGPLVAEVHVHPESRYWFIHVERSGMKYVCELGFYGKDEQWNSISVSGATITPPETVSGETAVEFAAIPLELPLPRLAALVAEAARENLPLAMAIEELRDQGHPELPSQTGIAAATPAPWTPAQERALAEVLSMDKIRRVWMGSLEITELLRGQFQRDLAAQAALAGAAPAAFAPAPAGEHVEAPAQMAAMGAISSPVGAGAPPSAPGFWFNVNAELIVYGATDPAATVTIGGRPVTLRPDGSFSYRFALPDGYYELAVVAVAADKTDGRAADMKFGRSTEYLGDVGISPQDPELKRPDPEYL